MISIEVQDWGLIDYNKALAQQLELVELISQKKHPETIIFCTHPPIVTLGRATEAHDVFAWQGPTVEISRGGRATYHGPSQLIAYPLIDLNESRPHLPLHDIAAFLNLIEQSVVRTLNTWNLKANGKSLEQIKNHKNNTISETGVWIEQQKIASLGIAIKKWISYHGVAINLDQDPSAFQGLNPCGFSSTVMTSLEQLVQRPVDRNLFQNKLTQELLYFLSK